MILRIISNHLNTASLQPFLKDTLVSMFYYNKTFRREITEAHQLEQVWHQWFATRRETKLLLSINHSQAINRFYLHFKAPAATLELSSSSAQSNTYHQWVPPLISLTPSSFHLKYPKMCQSINNRLENRLVLPPVHFCGEKSRILPLQSFLLTLLRCITHSSASKLILKTQGIHRIFLMQKKQS